ncbi:MAG: sodium-dependent transporter, partial [Pseudomonadales bacterium]|nr:sodium-dependent transporter [Pseudomonadales bacterium]
MSRKQDPYKGQLGRYSTFYLVLIGAAIGFGNVWRFPYLTGENGGGAFLLLYVICLFALGIPMMVAELVVGRVGKRNPVDSINVLCAKSGVTYWWQSIAWFAMAAGFIVLSFYSVVGGIAVAYIFYSAFGYFGATTESQMSFGVLNTNPGTLMGWHTLFLVIVMMVVKRGVRDGIGRAARMLMPLIVVIGFGLLIHAMDTVAFTDGFDYLFEFRPEQLSFSAILQALSHAFFSLTLSVGAMMALGAYMPDRMSAGRASAAVALTDMFLALMAGLIILPLSVSHSALPQQGFGLMFQTLSTAFGEMPWGQFW